MTRWYVALYDSSTDRREGGARQIVDGTEDDDGLERRWPEVLGWLEDDPARYAVVRCHADGRRTRPPIPALGIYGAPGVNG